MRDDWGVRREPVEHEVLDDGGLLYDVEISGGGSLTAKVRVYGRAMIDGAEYRYDHDVRVRLTREKRP